MPLGVLLYLFLVTLFLLAFIQLQLFTIGFEKLGLSPETASLILLGALGGSVINLPIFVLRADPRAEMVTARGRWYRMVDPLGWPRRVGHTIVAVNLGGCVIPLALATYFAMQVDLDAWRLLLGIAIVTLVSFVVARPIPGVGIGMPILLAPLLAVLVALLLEPAYRAQFAYISGVVGVLLGADVLHLSDVRRLGSPFVSIGGAGTFDGIFLTGILAALLA